jgi:Uma2 family endonuclease
MVTATTPPARTHRFGPDSAGTLMAPREFDRAEFVEGWRYELLHGVLIVTPPPLEEERDPNGELCYRLRVYRDTHPQGGALDGTLYEQTVKTRNNRRRADRVIWAGLGRPPRRADVPTIVIEFVSEGKRDRERDYEEKRDEYIAIGVREYWIIDRFKRLMTVYSPGDKKARKRVIREHQTYTTNLLPGFELPLGRLLAAADRWTGGDAPAE